MLFQARHKKFVFLNIKGLTVLPKIPFEHEKPTNSFLSDSEQNCLFVIPYKIFHTVFRSISKIKSITNGTCKHDFYDSLYQTLILQQ